MLHCGNIAYCISFVIRKFDFFICVFSAIYYATIEKEFHCVAAHPVPCVT